MSFRLLIFTIRINILLLFFLLLLFSRSISANEFYVAPGGSALWSECSNIETPCNYQLAMSNALAGDTVFFRGGVYRVVGNPPNYQALIQPKNSGESGRPIVFKAFSGELPVIEMDCTSSTNVCFAVGSNGKNYITWDGFKLTALNNKTAGAMIGREEYSEGLVFQNIEVVAGSAPVIHNDNRDVFRVENVRNSIIRKNFIKGFKSDDRTDHPQNNACIKIYDSDHLVLEHNELFGCPTGISAKRDMDDSIIRYNYISGNRIGIWNEVLKYVGTEIYFESDNNQIYGNIIANAEYISLHVAGDKFAMARNLDIHNNTFFSDNGLTKVHIGVTGTSGIIVYNNIFSIKGGGLYHSVYDRSTIKYMDFNYFGTPSFEIKVNQYDPGQAIYDSLDKWRSSGKLEGGGDPGQESMTSNINVLKNGSGTMMLISDYELQNDSFLKNAGRYGGDIGANPALVGQTEIPKAPDSVFVQ